MVSKCPPSVPLIIKLVPECPVSCPSVLSSLLLSSILNFIQSFPRQRGTETTINHHLSPLQGWQSHPCFSPPVSFLLPHHHNWCVPDSYHIFLKNIRSIFRGLWKRLENTELDHLQRKHPILKALFLNLVPTISTVYIFWPCLRDVQFCSVQHVIVRPHPRHWNPKETSTTASTRPCGNVRREALGRAGSAARTVGECFDSLLDSPQTWSALL